MPINWNTYAGFRPAPCMPCGDLPPHPSVCSCALLIPLFDSPYSDYATATTAIADQVASCIAYFSALATLGSHTASFDGTTLTVSGTDSAGGLNARISVSSSVSLLSGQTLNAAYSISTAGTIQQVSLSLIDCTDGSAVDSDDDTAPSGALVVTAPADGEYYIALSAGTTPPNFTHSIALSANVICSGTWWVNPVIALWDDSGTTRSLWACPKLLLPPLTEDTGDWYASCADAAAVLTSSKVSNCVGFDDVGNTSGLTSFSFSATDGGTSLSFAHDATGTALFSPTPAMQAWGGFNAGAGDVITVSWSASGTMGSGQSGTASIYDDTGTLVETVSNTTGANLVFSALPYTGRYSIKVTIGVALITNLFGSLSATASVSSSGSFSANPIQARWDAGLTCAATLDCGDSCP